MRYQKGEVNIGAIFIILYLFVVLFFVVGWVKNTISLIKLDFKEPYKAEVIRIIGTVVPPVGGITGWLNIQDK